MKIKVLSVSEVNNYLKRIVDSDFILNNLSVKGEISNLKEHSSGHVYFTLKDNGSKVNCVLFKGNAAKLSFRLEDGMEIVIRGRLSVYAVNGNYQIYCDEIEKQGLGELYFKYEQLKLKLEKEGYFDQKYKRALPEFVRKIGVVTSDTGAAIQDIKKVIHSRNKKVDIVLYPALVQGRDAYKTIIEGIEYFNINKNVDVIIVGRGGGSLEELWNFNEEELAKEIFHSKIPIVSAVGHEVDFTIADFVSDLRAATPSHAAEIVTPLLSDMIYNLNAISEKISNILFRRLSYENNKLTSIQKLLESRSPKKIVEKDIIKIKAFSDKLDILMSNLIDKEKNKIISLNEKLILNNPINLLNRGYLIIKDDNNNVLKTKEDFSEDKHVNIHVKDGVVSGRFIKDGGNV